MKCEQSADFTYYEYYIRPFINPIKVCIWFLAALCVISLTVSMFLFSRIKSNEIKIEIQNKKINVLIDKFEVQ